jgi:O-antigen/teichoic acid export membrane protein
VINAIVSKLTRFLPKSGMGRSVIALASSTAAAQAITAIAMPVVTRLYTPAEIGIISIFISFFGFWSVMLSLRYESAILISQTGAESHQVFRVGMICVVSMSALSAPILGILVRSGTLGFGLMPLWSVLATAPIMFGYGLFMMYRSWGLRSGLVRDISRATVMRALSNGLARIVLGIGGVGVPGLFVAELAGAWSATGALFRSVRERHAASRPAFSWSDLARVAKKYSKFAVYETPSVAIDQLALTIPVPMIGALYGAQAAGWFGLARILVAIPNAQIGRAIADVFQMELASKVRKGTRAEAHQLFYTLVRKLALFGLLPLAVMMVVAPLVVPWIFGRLWAPMGTMTAIIAPWLYAALIVTTLSRLLSVLERQEYKLIYDVTALLLIGAVYAIARYHALGLMESIMLLSGANIIGYVVYFVVIVHIVEKDLKEDA